VAAAPEEVETSALTTAAALRDLGVRRAFVIGEHGLLTALGQVGIERVDADAQADAVVIGWDRQLTYDKLRAATGAVQRGAGLYASNDDVTYPGPDGVTWPGTGASVRALEAATGLRATVFGKPNAPILEAARTRAGGGRSLVVGDRVETDIEGARRLRWDSALVLTGISTPDDLRAAGIASTYVIEDLRTLVEE